MKKFLLLAILAGAFSMAGKAQDKIYRENGKIIECKVLEVGSSEVKYKEAGAEDGPIYILETDRIKKIVFANGKVQTFTDNMKDPERYASNRKMALKFNFLSPLYGYTEIGFEKSTGVGKSFELSVGVIGAGKAGTLGYYSNQLQEIKRDPFGLFVSGGYKFSKLPDFLIFGKTRASHLMQGTYVKPIAYVGAYKENIVIDKNGQVEIGKQNVTFGAIQLELGRQWVFSDRFMLDMYWGVGYGFDNKKSSYQYNGFTDIYDESSAYNYVNARGGKSPGISGTFGIKLGWLIK